MTDPQVVCGHKASDLDGNSRRQSQTPLAPEPRTPKPRTLEHERRGVLAAPMPDGNVSSIEKSLLSVLAADRLLARSLSTVYSLVSMPTLCGAGPPMFDRLSVPGKAACNSPSFPASDQSCLRVSIDFCCTVNSIIICVNRGVKRNWRKTYSRQRMSDGGKGQPGKTLMG